LLGGLREKGKKASSSGGEREKSKEKGGGSTREGGAGYAAAKGGKRVGSFSHPERKGKRFSFKERISMAIGAKEGEESTERRWAVSKSTRSILDEEKREGRNHRLSSRPPRSGKKGLTSSGGGACGAGA